MSTGRSRAKYLLRTYGLTPREWKRIWRVQGEVCGLCYLPILGRPNTDHEHVKGYRQMKASEKRRYVRGIVHAYPCNKFLIGRHKIGSARQLLEYLEHPPAKMALR